MHKLFGHNLGILNLYLFIGLLKIIHLCFSCNAQSKFIGYKVFMELFLRTKYIIFAD